MFGQKISVFIRSLCLLLCALLCSTAVVACHAKVEKPTQASEGTYLYEQTDIAQDEETGISYVNNILLIFCEPGTADNQKEAIAKALGGEIAGRLDMIDQIQVRVAAQTLSELDALCEKAEGMEGVQAAMVDTASQYTGDYLPNDPYGKTWYNFWMDNTWDTAKPSGNNWWAEAVDAPGAWEYKDRLSPVQVGVIDNGFDQKHEDLSIEIVNPDVVNREDHGTHVAGIIGAEMDNGKGIAGLAPNAVLHGYDYAPDWIQDLVGGWDTTSSILAGFSLSLKNGGTDRKMVINLSAGQTGSLPTSNDVFSEEAVDRNGALASQYMASLLIRGYDFVVVQSAGNGAADHLGVDARYNGLFAAIDADNCVTANGKVTVTAQDIMDRVIIVGAAGEQDENGVYMQTSFSNGGDQVDIAAPGVSIYSTVAGGYDAMQGTSMAAPMVAATAAMVWGANPALKGRDIKAILCENTAANVLDHPNSPKALGSYPLLNAKLAVEAAFQATPSADFDASCYDPILEEYRKGAQNNYYNGDFSTLPHVNQELYLSSAGHDLYYALEDISGDAIPELIIAECSPELTNGYNIYDLYGWDGKQVQRLFDVYSMGYRALYTICEDSVIAIAGSSSAFDQSYTYYTLPKNSVKPQLKEELVYSGWEGDKYYRNGTDNPISKEEFEAIRSSYQLIALDWQPLFAASQEPTPAQPSGSIPQVVQSHTDEWEPHIGETSNYGPYFVYFMDLDCNGAPEFIVQSPLEGTGRFTYLFVYQVDQNGGFSQVLTDWGENGGPDDFTLCKDKAAGKMFYVAHDYARGGAEYYGEMWARIENQNGAIVATPLFSYSNEKQSKTYYGSDGKTPISQAEYETLSQNFWNSVEKQSEPGNSIYVQNWPKSASDSEKLHMLEETYATLPKQ